MADVLTFADRIVLPYAPRTVFVYEGDNDLANGKSPDEVVGDFRTLVQRVQEQLPRTRIGFIAVKPSLKRWHLVESIRSVNSQIADLAMHDERIEFIDIFNPMLGPDGMPRKELFVEDGLHLNAEGYGLWTRVIREHHSDLLRTRSNPD